MLVKRVPRRAAAEHLNSLGHPITNNQLTKLACVGGGPKYALFGNKAVYAIDDLEQWANDRLKHRGGDGEAAQTERRR